MSYVMRIGRAIVLWDYIDAEEVHGSLLPGDYDDTSDNPPGQPTQRILFSSDFVKQSLLRSRHACSNIAAGFYKL
jgi:hypothetical protein